jgi:adenylate cyclase
MITGLNSLTSEQNLKINNTLSKIENVFRPFLPGKTIDPGISEELRSILKLLLKQDMTGYHGEGRVNVTILLSDIRGFTSLVEETSPDIIINLLNQYFSKMCTIIDRHHGKIDKFMGDSIMVLFGTSPTGDDDVLPALICAAEMQIAMDDLNSHFRQFGFPELYMGIGINTGEVTAGMIGSELHWEYTVIGDEVNLTSRIEAYSLRGQVLISQSTYDQTKKYIKTGDGVEVDVKGKKRPVILYELKTIEYPVRIDVPGREIRKSPRVNVLLPFYFQRITAKAVKSQTYQGIILDISYNGLMVELPKELKAFSEIKLSFNFYAINEQYTDIYAKVLNCWENKNDTFQCSLEFSSLGIDSAKGIKKCVHHLIQGDAV